MSETETEPRSPPRPPCPAPADFRAEVADYDRNAEVVALGRPALPDDVPGPRRRAAADPHPRHRLDLSRLLPDAQPLAGRFRTIVYDYPGEHPDDGARLGRITHEHLVDDVFGLIDHLNLGRVFLFGLSFGSTITLKALHREPRRFPKAVVQGGFARRQVHARGTSGRFGFGRLAPGQRLAAPAPRAGPGVQQPEPLPEIIDDRWTYYVEQNGLTPIAALAHRLDLLARLDLRPILPEIPTEVLLLQGNEDRIVRRRYFDELKAGLPRAEGVIMPLVGHQPHYTHAEALAQAIGELALRESRGCPNEAKAEPA